MFPLPQAIANRFVTGNGKHDGILPPMARDLPLEKSSRLSPLDFITDLNQLHLPRAGCKSRGKAGPGFWCYFPCWVLTITMGKARVGYLCDSHTLEGSHIRKGALDGDGKLG